MALSILLLIDLFGLFMSSLTIRASHSVCLLSECLSLNVHLCMSAHMGVSHCYMGGDCQSPLSEQGLSVVSFHKELLTPCKYSCGVRKLASELVPSVHCIKGSHEMQTYRKIACLCEISRRSIF